MEDLWIRVLLTLPLTLMALSAHEAAHAYAAYLLGDKTAQERGRLTLMPFAHIDPFGTVALPLLLALGGGPVFGYAKPTPVDPSRLRSPKLGYSIVALAGPASNLLLALSLSLAGLLLVRGLDLRSASLELVLGMGIFINVILGFFNLLPLPGFDGLKVLYAVLPDSWCWRLNRAEGLFIVVLVMGVYLGLFIRLSTPAYSATDALCRLAGIPFPRG